jgi:hypothetical protein
MDEFERLETQLKPTYEEFRLPKAPSEPIEIPIIRQPEVHAVDREGL